MAKYFLKDTIICTEDTAHTLESHVPVSSLDLGRKQLSYATTNFFLFFLAFVKSRQIQGRSKSFNKLFTKPEADSPTPEHFRSSWRWKHSSMRWEAQLQAPVNQAEQKFETTPSTKLLAISKSSQIFQLCQWLLNFFWFMAPLSIFSNSSISGGARQKTTS